MSKKALYGLAILVLLVVIFLTIKSGKEAPTAGEETGSSFLPWSEALTILKSGVVERVAQTHDLDVELLLKDGTTITTQEPAIDDIFREITACGSPCASIALVTE